MVEILQPKNMHKKNSLSNLKKKKKKKKKKNYNSPQTNKIWIIAINKIFYLNQSKHYK